MGQFDNLDLDRLVSITGQDNPAEILAQAEGWQGVAWLFESQLAKLAAAVTEVQQSWNSPAAAAFVQEIARVQATLTDAQTKANGNHTAWSTIGAQAKTTQEAIAQLQNDRDGAVQTVQSDYATAKKKDADNFNWGWLGVSDLLDDPDAPDLAGIRSDYDSRARTIMQSADDVYTGQYYQNLWWPPAYDGPADAQVPTRSISPGNTSTGSGSPGGGTTVGKRSTGDQTGSNKKPGDGSGGDDPPGIRPPGAPTTPVGSAPPGSSGPILTGTPTAPVLPPPTTGSTALPITPPTTIPGGSPIIPVLPPGTLPPGGGIKPIIPGGRKPLLPTDVPGGSPVVGGRGRGAGLSVPEGRSIEKSPVVGNRLGARDVPGGRALEGAEPGRATPGGRGLPAEEAEVIGRGRAGAAGRGIPRPTEAVTGRGAARPGEPASGRTLRSVSEAGGEARSGGRSGVVGSRSGENARERGGSGSVGKRGKQRRRDSDEKEILGDEQDIWFVDDDLPAVIESPAVDEAEKPAAGPHIGKGPHR